MKGSFVRLSTVINSIQSECFCDRRKLLPIDLFISSKNFLNELKFIIYTKKTGKREFKYVKIREMQNNTGKNE
jgi:hypothetical protein